MDGLAMAKRLLELAGEVPDEQSELRALLKRAALLSYAQFQAGNPELQVALAETEAEIAAGFPGAVEADAFITGARAAADQLRRRAAG